MITAAIVLFKENHQELKRTVDSFLNIALDKKLYLIDNSPTDVLVDKFTHPDIEFIFNATNKGFGAAHNQVLQDIKDRSTYHLVLNPDVIFEPKVIPNLITFFERDQTLALVAPKVLFATGKPQYSCRRYPFIFEMIVRRIGPLKPFFSSLIKKGEYRDTDLTKAFYPDALQGCFLLFKTKDFVAVNGFDERYFMYMEDIDICKKIDQLNKKKLYAPSEEILHVLKRASSRNLRYFFIHLKSAFKYFKKWGI